MKLENQVCSLDLAKRLRELGVKQESYFYWMEYGNPHLLPGKDSSIFYEKTWRKRVSAFTVAELGEMLPIEYISQRRPHGSIDSGEYAWGCGRYGTDFAEVVETEVDARAKMLIYLIENKVITV